jgi:uncharacterized membrane protein
MSFEEARTVCMLIVVEVVVLFLSDFRKTKNFFKIVPAVFWIYFLPMVMSTVGLIPRESSIYGVLTACLLPASLILLLLGTDLRAISKLGAVALGMMLTGSVGILLGSAVVLRLFSPWLPRDTWMGFAALCASWTGGSANMIAVKEAIGTPDVIFLPMVAVDVVVSYSWMAFLMSLRGLQSRYDDWNQSKSVFLEKARARVDGFAKQEGMRVDVSGAILIVFAGGLGTLVSVNASKLMPAAGGFSSQAWAILIATTLGICFSFTPLRRLESRGASRIGYVLLYLVLASIGAKASLEQVSRAPLFIAAGFLWLVIHFSLLLFVAKLGKVPLAFAAIASQANVGGPVSAPIVAAVYDRRLAPVGLLLGICGSLIGTYAGLASAVILRWIERG